MKPAARTETKSQRNAIIWDGDFERALSRLLRIDLDLKTRVGAARASRLYTSRVLSTRARREAGVVSSHRPRGLLDTPICSLTDTKPTSL